MAEKRRVRRKEAGYIGVNLVVDNDTTLLERFEEELKSTMMGASTVVRLALLEYFEKKDKK